MFLGKIYLILFNSCLTPLLFIFFFLLLENLFIVFNSYFTMLSFSVPQKHIFIHSFHTSCLALFVVHLPSLLSLKSPAPHLIFNFPSSHLFFYTGFLIGINSLCPLFFWYSISFAPDERRSRSSETHCVKVFLHGIRGSFIHLHCD